MLQRKIEKKIKEFYENNDQKALMITGARQVGKSYIIDAFAKENYEHYIKVDFVENPEYVSVFQSAKSAEDILLRLSAIAGSEMIPGQTMIFFDEVQECAELVTKIKYLVQEGSYHYILSGSLLGTILKDLRSVPVGYMEILQMYPLDFEEFALANGVGEKVFAALEDCFKKQAKVDAFLHERMMSLYALYLVVGGMPAAVCRYLETKNIQLVHNEQQSILQLYKRDIAKYDKEEKLYLNDIFNLIPSELNAKNKRFILKNMHGKPRYALYQNSFIWLRDAGVALPVHVVDAPKEPLLLSKVSNLFKLYSSDVGLLTSQYGIETQLQVLHQGTDLNCGAIYENGAAQELKTHGYDLYFYNGKKFGELDFVIEEKGQVLPIEIKSGKDYYRHLAMNNVLGCEEFQIQQGYVFCNGNVEKYEKTVYYPIYMLMFLQKKKTVDDVIITDDFSDINQLV